MDKAVLYEDVQVNIGKKRSDVWNDYAISFLNETFTSDYSIYKRETQELYSALFGEEELFEECSDIINEDSARAIAQGAGPRPIPAPSSRALAQGIKKDEVLSFGGKLKALFTNLGSGVKSYFSKGIAGVIANPWPIIAAGAGVGAVVALVKKFKKLSDEKKKAALQRLPKDQREKAVAVLAKSEDELKKELEASKKEPEGK